MQVKVHKKANEFSKMFKHYIRATAFNEENNEWAFQWVSPIDYIFTEQ